MKKLSRSKCFVLLPLIIAATHLGISRETVVLAQEGTIKLPSAPLKFGVFVARFDPAATLKRQADRGRTVEGNWKISGNEIELTRPGAPGACAGPARYRVRADGNHIGFDVVSDDCQIRRMIFDRSTWAPLTEVKTVPPRTITRTAGARPPSNTKNSSKGSWPSFRGP